MSGKCSRELTIEMAADLPSVCVFHKCSGVEPSCHMITPMHYDRVTHDDVVKKWYVKELFGFWF